MLKRFIHAGITSLLAIGMLSLPAITATAGDTNSEDASTSVKKDPYTVVQVTDHQDGSGFGTADAPYVTKEHGYTVGDEGPKDGVVTSGDVAWYKVHVTFLAAKHREVTIKFDGLGDALKATKSYCPTGQFISGWAGDGGCVYTIPTGVSESFNLTLNLTANDTGGKTVTVDPKIIVERQDGGTRGLKLGRLKVTSVPMMDVYLDKDDSQSGETTASFFMQTRALHPAGASNYKGFSRFVPYSALLDLTGLPDGITVSVDGNDLTPTAGILRLPEKVGGRDVTVSGLPQPNPSEQRKYDLHIAVSSSMPGWRGQPGDGLGRNDSTLDEKTGARAGVSYPNNDWLMISTTGQTEYNPPKGEDGGVGDMLHFDRPYTRSQTKWDDGNLMWSSASSSWFDPVWMVGYGSQSYTYGHNMEFTAKAHLDFSGHTGDKCPDDNPCVTYYQWGEGLTMTSLPTATDENGASLPGGTYKVLYGVNSYPFNYATADKIGYHRGDYPDAFLASLTDTPPSDPTTIHRIVILRTGNQPKGWLSWGMKATALGSTEVTGIGTNSAGHTQLTHDATIQVTDPRPSAAGINDVDYKVDRSHWMVATTTDGDIEAGDRITGAWQPTITDVPTTTQPVTTNVDVCLPQGLTDTTLTATGWTVKETSSAKCATEWHLMYTGKASYDSNYEVGQTADTDIFYLPKISWEGTIQPTAEGTLTPSITGTVHMDAWRSLPADTQAISRAMFLPVTLPSTNVSIADTGMNDDTAPIHDPGANDPVTWTVAATAGSPVSAMMALPDPADCNQLMNGGKGPEGNWYEYDRGCTTNKERLIGQPTVDTAMTRGDVSLQYTTAGITSLDPSAYTWQSWDDIKDKTTITGIKATVGSPDNSVTLTRINMTLSGMKNEGQADVWAGAPYRDGKALTSVSWPGVVEHKKAIITFRLFKDVDEDGVFTATDQVGESGRATSVDVYQSDENGTKGALAGSGYYIGDSSQWKKDEKFLSGWYLVVAHIDGSKENGSIKDTDGNYVTNLGSLKTYYGKSDNTRATTPTSRLIHVDAGGTATVDFGWMADTPRLSVTQKETLKGCDSGYCKATVTATLSNDGETTIPDDTLIHSTLSAGSASDEWSYSTLVMDGEHTVNGSLLRDTSGHYWAYDRNSGTYDYGMIRYTAFDGFDTVEATHDSIQGFYASWAVTTDGRVLSASPYPGSTRASAFILSDSTVKSYIGVFSPPEGRKFIHVRACYDGPCAIAQTDDGALWMYHMTGSSPDYAGSGFTKLDTGDAKFDLTKQPKTFGAQIMLIDSQHRFWTMDNKTGTLSQGGMLYNNDNWVDQNVNIKVPFDGGPTSIKDIATLPGDGSVYYTYGKYINDLPVAAVVDADGRLWICHKHRINSNDNYTVVWDKTNVTGVAQLAGVYDGNSNPFYNAWSSSLKAHTVWYLGEDGGLYRFDPDTMMRGKDTYSRADDTSLLESNSAVPSYGTPVRVLPDKTFSKLMVIYSGGRRFAAITTSGRLYTWGSGDSIADRTPNDTSVDAPRQTMTALPDSTDDKTSTFKLPFQLAPGETVTLTRTLTIPRSDKDTIATTQTWADGSLTPYKGITGLDAPTPPDAFSATPESSDGRITGNSSCMMEGHKYDITNTYYREDQCEQNGVKVPALDKGTTIITGGISGVAWLDENGDGIHQPSESIRPGVKVRLADKTGATLQTTETTANGGYSFTGLTPGEYTVWMTESSPKLMWTTQHVGSDTTVDSDINPGLEDYGSATVTLTNDKPNAEHVDGGLTERPTTGTLPHSGRIGIILLVAACLLLLAAGVFRTRRGGYSGRSARVKAVPRHSATA